MVGGVFLISVFYSEHGVGSLIRISDMAYIPLSRAPMRYGVGIRSLFAGLRGMQVAMAVHLFVGICHSDLDEDPASLSSKVGPGLSI